MRAATTIAFLLAFAAVSAQQLTLQQTTNLAILEGRVTAADGATPIHGARVTVQSDAGTTGSVRTDDQGRFQVFVPRNPAPALRIEKAGYAPREVRRPSSSLDPVDISLDRAAVVMGRVVDAAGQPVVHAGVRLHRLDAADAPQPTEFHAETDDRGEYRIGNLAAGRYVASTYRSVDISARLDALTFAPVTPAPRVEMLRKELSVRPAMSATTTINARAGEELTATLVHADPAVTLPYAEVGGVISGVLVDEFGEPATDVSLRLWQTRFSDGRTVIQPIGRLGRTDDRGRYRLFHIPAGRYLVVATPGTDPSDPIASRQAPFLPVYYPGKLNVAEAWSVTVGRSQERPGVDMIVERVRGTRVHGLALNSAGRPLRTGRITLVASQRDGSASLPPQYATQSPDGRFAGLSGTPAADGAFELSNVPPGNYVVQAAALRGDDPMHVQITEFVVQRITVTGADIGPLAIQTLPTSTISGQITLEGGSITPNPGDFVLNVVPADPDEAPFIRGLRPEVHVAPDWTFRIDGVTGRARVTLSRATRGWWLKSVDIGGINAAEDPANFGTSADSRNDVTAVLASTGSAIAGRVVDDRRQSVDSYIVVAFAADRTQWFSGSRYVTTADPGVNGRFSIVSLAPGDYLVAAIEAGDGDVSTDWRNPDALENLSASAERITLGEGQSRTIVLRLTRLPR